MITINYEPSGYPSAHNPMFVELTSGNSALTDFKYVFDIYVNNVFKTRQKVFPDPTDNKGYLDIQSVVRNELDNAVNVVTVGSSVPVELGLGEFYVDFYGIYGEESSGVTYASSATGQTWKAYNWTKSRVQRKIPNTQDSGGNYLTKLQDFIGYFLTTRPQNTKVYDNQPLILTYWGQPEEPVNLYIDNLNPTSTTTVFTEVDFTNPKVFDLGTSYNQSAGSFTARIAPPLEIAESLASLSFVPTCHPRYEPVTLMFMNRWGGFDSYTFGLYNEISIDADRKSFGQNPYVGRTDLISGGFVRESKKVFAVSYLTKWKLTSDSLTKDEYKWLEELITSPLVYVYIDDPNNERYWHPVTITETNYQIKDHLIQKDNILELNIEFAEPDNAQYR